MLDSVCLKLNVAWLGRDYATLADEVHKLRSSVSYIGGRELDAMATECEPLLWQRSAGSPGKSCSTLEEVMPRLVAEADDLRQWLREVLRAP